MSIVVTELSCKWLASPLLP